MNDQQSQDDLNLWQQWMATHQANPSQSQIDPNSLACYLDGTANPSVIESIEEAMASNPQLLERVIELRQIQNQIHGSEGQIVPNHVQQAAANLITPQGLEPPASFPWKWYGLQRAAAAAVVLAAGITGYLAGTNTYQDNSLAESATADVVTQLSDMQEESPSLWAIVMTGDLL